MAEKDINFPVDRRDPDELDFSKSERKEIEKRNLRRLQRDMLDLKRVLEFVEGRRVIARILYKACVFNEFGDIIDTSFNSNSMSMAYTEGSRRLGFSLINDIKKSNPNALQQIQRERESDLISDKENVEK